MYTYMKAKIAHFAKSEKGASAIEYGLIAGLIAIAAIAAMGFLGGGLGTAFTSACGAIPGATCA